MKHGASRRCRPRVALTLAVGLLLSAVSHALLASDDTSGAAKATDTAAQQLDCTKHGGKVNTFRCATRPLDTVPGGQWLKWILGFAIVVGAGYQTIRHLAGFLGGARSDPPKRDVD
jgi:hypothetical protein